MEWKRSRVFALTIALSMLTVGFALSASAQKTDKHTPRDQVTYVNTDNGLVWCPLGEEVTVETPDEVNVHDPRDGTVLHSEPLVPFSHTEDVTDPKHGNALCIGGASFAYTSTEDPGVVSDIEGADEWSIWAQEEAHHQLGGTSCAAPGEEKDPDQGDKVLCPSGFAQIRSTYTFETDYSSKTGPATYTCATGDWTDVCVQDNPENPAASETTSVSWVTHKFTVCNDIKVDVDDSVLGATAAENEVSKSLGDHIETEHNLLFFLSGPDIVLDCFNDGFGIADTVKSTYVNTVVPALNSVTCTGEDSGLPGPLSGLDDPGEDLPNLVCFLDPFGTTSCDERVGTIGTLGTIGTDFGTANAPDSFCNEDGAALDDDGNKAHHDDARILQGTADAVTVENVPVSTE